LNEEEGCATENVDKGDCGDALSKSEDKADCDKRSQVLSQIEEDDSAQTFSESEQRNKTTNDANWTKQDVHADCDDCLSENADEEDDSIDAMAGRIQKEPTCKEVSQECIKNAQNDIEESAHPNKISEGHNTQEGITSKKASLTFVQHDKAAPAANKSKKRKSATDLQEAPEMKKLRKSQRLENKRLAKQMNRRLTRQSLKHKIFLHNIVQRWSYFLTI
jgi:hypothetical protein